MNQDQLFRFRQALAMLPAAPASLAASHGAMLGSDYHFDMVRPGIKVDIFTAQPTADRPGRQSIRIAKADLPK